MKGSPTGNAVIEDYINSANAEINLAFIYSEVLSFQTTLTRTTGCYNQSVNVLVDIGNSL